MSDGLGFGDPVTSGIFLLIPAIRSPNYSPGVAGWTINRDGSAEFNNLTIRGTFTGTDFDINAAGFFMYSGTPALGNMLLSIAAAAGTDSFGNVYPAGLKVYNGLAAIADPAALTFPSGASFENAQAQIASSVGGTSPAQFIQLSLQSASDQLAGARDRVGITLNSANADGSSDANMEFLYQGSNGTFHEYAFVDSTGFNALAAAIVGVDPGSSPATPATWHTIALQNGYTAGTNNGFTDVPQIRMMADNVNLQFKGSLTCPAAPASNNWGTLPTGFPNANLGGPFGYGVVANYSGGTTDHVVVQNSSNIALNNGTAHGGITFNLSCMVPTQ